MLPFIIAFFAMAVVYVVFNAKIKLENKVGAVIVVSVLMLLILLLS